MDAPGPTPEERAAAAAAAIRARRAAKPAELAATRQRGIRTRRALLVGAGSLVLVLATAGIAWSIVQLTAPTVKETVAAAKTSAAPTETPTPTQTAAQTFTLNQVGEDLMLRPQDPSHPYNYWTVPDETIAATALGERAGWVAQGYLTDAGRFCMSIENGAEGHGNCVPGEDFMSDGITIDRGPWQVTWLPDGTVTWTGI